VSRPEKPFEELAYVLKLSFDGKIPPLDKYVEINCTPNYYLVPGDNRDNLVLGADLTTTRKRKDFANQWKIESAGKGLYRILNRNDNKKALTCTSSGTTGHELMISDRSGKDNEVWKIENSLNGVYKISNKEFPFLILSANATPAEGDKVEMINAESGKSSGWNLKEVCEYKQEAFKSNTIPGTIEAEDYDKGCPEDAYFDKDESNQGGRYRQSLGIDIDTCSAGGYVVGWTNPGEWMAYTVNVQKTATYQVTFYIAAPSDYAKLHLECDDKDLTGIFTLPNTAGYQN
jgi:hypothetical protein